MRSASIKDNHWTDDVIDRIEALEKAFQVAYDALTFVDGNGFCCKSDKDGCHKDRCTVVLAMCEIAAIKRNAQEWQKINEIAREAMEGKSET